jgi:tRNA 2-thiouridine synthesizing protein A
MSNIVDARGLSCPQPVLLTVEKIKQLKAGKLEILVDTETAVENVKRAVTNNNWTVEVVNAVDGEFNIRAIKA